MGELMFLLTLSLSFLLSLLADYAPEMIIKGLQRERDLAEKQRSRRWRRPVGLELGYQTAEELEGDPVTQRNPVTQQT